MKKLRLNKRTIARMDKAEMESVKGGLCLVSCKNGSAKGKKCCGPDGFEQGVSPFPHLTFIKR
ncbi:MAG: class I lanthipeptide [Bacteroidota bacterium]